MCSSARIEQREEPEKNNSLSHEVREVLISEIDDFPEHPFKIRMDEEMQQLIDSIRNNGIIVPVIVRPKENGRYEMISGHRRKKASEVLNLESVPAEIRSMTRDEATIMMVESNFQRTKILPSEKAFSYKMRLDALKHQGKRNDLTSDPLGPKLKIQSNQILAEKVSESESQIKRYIRLTNLIPPMLQLVDGGNIGLRVAVELSFLTKTEQGILLDLIDRSGATPSLSQAIAMKKLSRTGCLSKSKTASILAEEKPNQREKIVLQTEKVRKLIPKNIGAQQTEEYIIRALEYYQKRLQKKMER